MKSKIEYIRPLISNTLIEIEEKLADQKYDFTYYEIWIDYITEFRIDALKNLVNKSNKKLILVTRRLNLEEQILEKSLVLKVIEEFINHKNILIDCDLRQKEELDLIFKINSNKLLLSYHNYTKTPENLDDIIKEMSNFNPYIYKLACFCNTETDALRLLEVGLELKNNDKKNIITGMGAKGKIVRIASALWFNEYNFAPLTKEEETAEGQICIEDLNKIIGIFS